MKALKFRLTICFNNKGLDFINLNLGLRDMQIRF